MMKRRVWIGLVVLMAGMVAQVQGAEDFLVDHRGQWLAEAKQGSAEAEYKLGKSYCCGFGGSYNSAKAFHWFCLAAKQGYRDAQYEMGRQLSERTDTWTPFGDVNNMIQAYAWYSLAEAQGHPMARLYRVSLENDLSDRALAAAKDYQRQWTDVNCGG